MDIAKQLHKLSTIGENFHCAECKAKGPTWTSYSLGIFICMKCASAHRQMGVSISRVKSISLDEWTEQQFKNMKTIGNKKARDFYEAGLPDDFKRPRELNELTKFIRDKYELRKYVRGCPPVLASYEPVVEKTVVSEKNLIDFDAPVSLKSSSEILDQLLEGNLNMIDFEEIKVPTCSKVEMPKSTVDEIMSCFDSQQPKVSEKPSKTQNIANSTSYSANDFDLIDQQLKTIRQNRDTL